MDNKMDDFLRPEELSMSHMTMTIEQEVWLRAYCAVIAHGGSVVPASFVCQNIADTCLRDFKNKFGYNE